MGQFHPIVDAFVDGAEAVITEMVSTELEIESFEVAGGSVPGGEMVISMSLEAENAGFVVICMEHQLGEYLVSEMLKVEEGDVADDELLDGLEELLNMIAGAAKTTLEKSPDVFNLSLPCAMRAGSSEIVTPPDCDGVVARFRIGADPFILAIWRTGIGPS